jgi:hypothetical protein
MSSEQKKLLDFRCCKFVVFPNSKVCRCRDVLGVGDKFGSAFLLGDNMHGPTYFGAIVKNASNMPERPIWCTHLILPLRKCLKNLGVLLHLEVKVRRVNVKVIPRLSIKLVRHK